LDDFDRFTTRKSTTDRNSFRPGPTKISLITGFVLAIGFFGEHDLVQTASTMKTSQQANNLTLVVSTGGKSRPFGGMPSRDSIVSSLADVIGCGGAWQRRER
jgi:hypothetical protein